MATELAVARGIKVHTIGIGTTGKFKIPENSDRIGNRVKADLIFDR